MLLDRAAEADYACVRQGLLVWRRVVNGPLGVLLAAGPGVAALGRSLLLRMALQAAARRRAKAARRTRAKKPPPSTPGPSRGRWVRRPLRCTISCAPSRCRGVLLGSVRPPVHRRALARRLSMGGSRRRSREHRENITDGLFADHWRNMAHVKPGAPLEHASGGRPGGWASAGRGRGGWAGPGGAGRGQASGRRLSRLELSGGRPLGWPPSLSCGHGRGRTSLTRPAMRGMRPPRRRLQWSPRPL